MGDAAARSVRGAAVIADPHPHPRSLHSAHNTQSLFLSICLHEDWHTILDHHRTPFWIIFETSTAALNERLKGGPRPLALNAQLLHSSVPYGPRANFHRQQPAREVVASVRLHRMSILSCRSSRVRAAIEP